MKHHDILIITNLQIDENILEGLDYIILQDATIKDLNFCNDFSFDYLITDKENVLEQYDLIKDNGYYLTNCYFHSSYEGVFIIGHLNKSTKDLNYQISKIIEMLTE
ncbi:MAG: hypothetical protein ACI4U5_06770 [Bacilli bacterium]